MSAPANDGELAPPAHGMVPAPERVDPHIRDIADGLNRLAHELNNPLAALRSALFMLREAVDPGHRFAHYLPQAEEQVERAATIVTRINGLRLSALTPGAPAPPGPTEQSSRT